MAFLQRRTNVSDVGPPLYKCYTNVLCFSHCGSDWPTCVQVRIIPHSHSVARAGPITSVIIYVTYIQNKVTATMMIFQEV